MEPTIFTSPSVRRISPIIADSKLVYQTSSVSERI